ncbi:MAG: EamA family transporter RarD, partial [Pseudomonadota bacterium]
VWAVPMAALVMLAWGRWGEISALFRDWRLVRMMMLTAALIAANWGIYVYSIAANITSQAALGYYITPLMNVALGTLLLGERMTKLQTAAVAIAAVAVLVKAVWAGEVPYIGLALTTSFAVYGYLRKTVPVGATPGFLMEVVLLAPFALAYLLWVAVQGQAAFGTDLTLTALLIGCGPVTAIPLILYAVGARGLRLTTLGLMQYIAPTLIFIVSFTVFGEEFTRVEAVTFALIWTALALYSWSMLRGNGTT